MTKIGHFLTTLVTAIAGTSVCMPIAFAQANGWPNKPVRLIVPYSAGGFTDVVARTVAKSVGDRLGQAIVVDNKPGANSIIGVDAVAKSAPDGYTFGFVIAAYAVNTTLYPKLPYYPAKDIQAVSLVGKSPLIAAVNKDSPYKSVRELMDNARTNPKAITFGSSGSGSATHLSMELLQSQSKVQLTHIPYKGNAPALTDLLGGQIDFMFTTPDAFLSMAKSGKVRMIGIANEQRIAVAPDVPTFKEQGLGDFNASTWAGIVAPAGTPPQITKRISEEVAAILKTPEVKTKLDAIGFVPVGSTPKEFESFVDSETKRWGAVIRANNLTAEN